MACANDVSFSFNIAQLHPRNTWFYGRGKSAKTSYSSRVKESDIRDAVGSCDDVLMTNERAAASVQAFDEQTDLPRPSASCRLLAMHDVGCRKT